MKFSRVWMGIVVLSGLINGSALYGQITYEPYSISLFAGTPGISGSSDGTGSAALFNSPVASAVDVNGNIYIADSGSNTIRKITPAGVVSTLAGSAGPGGSADGTGSAAQFELPQGIAVDNTGNVYVGDSGNLTIRKITPGGVVTTIAGQVGQEGSNDGPGNMAKFGLPIGLSVDGTGNIYVADAGNNNIRMITPGNVVSTVAGLAGNPGSNDGTGSAAQFFSPYGVAWSSSAGVVYVADTSNDTIRSVTPAGVVMTVAGSPGNAGTSDGIGAAARFDMPKGIAVDGSGNVYIACTNSSTIRKMGPGAVVTTLAGSPGSAMFADGIGGHARFNSPYALAATSTGHIYVADTFNRTVRFGVLTSVSVTITNEANGKKLLTGHAFPNVMVDIVATSSMANSFQPLITVMADSNGNFQYEDTATIKRFYKASVSGS